MISNLLFKCGRGLRPHLKLNPLLAAIGVGSAVGTMASNIYTTGSNAALTREGWARQDRENERMRDWQSSEWDRQFSEVNAYNSPKAIARRLQGAGFNPVDAFTDASAPTGSSAQPQSNAPGSPNYAQHFPVVNPASNIMDVAQAILALTEAQKNEKLTDSQKANLDALTQSYTSQAEKNIEETNYQKMFNELYAAYGERKLSKGLEKLSAEIAEINSRSDNEKSEADLNRMREIREEILSHLDGVNLQITQNTLDHWLEQYQADLAETKSRIAANYGTAEQAREGALDLRLTRESRIKLNEAYAGYQDALKAVANSDAWLKDHTNSIKVLTSLREFQRVGIINREEMAKADRLIRQNRFIEFKVFMESLNSQIGNAKDMWEMVPTN